VDQRDRILSKRAVNDRYGDRNVPVTSKANYLAALIPSTALARTGAYGVARSHQKAREAMNPAERLHPTTTWSPRVTS